MPRCQCVKWRSRCGLRTRSKPLRVRNPRESVPTRRVVSGRLSRGRTYSPGVPGEAAGLSVYPRPLILAPHLGPSPGTLIDYPLRVSLSFFPCSSLLDRFFYLSDSVSSHSPRPPRLRRSGQTDPGLRIPRTLANPRSTSPPAPRPDPFRHPPSGAPGSPPASDPLAYGPRTSAEGGGGSRRATPRPGLGSVGEAGQRGLGLAAGVSVSEGSRKGVGRSGVEGGRGAERGAAVRGSNKSSPRRGRGSGGPGERRGEWRAPRRSGPSSVGPRTRWGCARGPSTPRV